MKSMLDKFNNKVYATPMLFIFGFALLAIVVHQIDLALGEVAPSIAFSASFLRALLVLIIGGFITMVTITFSSIMVVLTTYSGQFSPRTLNDFLVRKVPLRILGYFMGVMVYATLILTLSFREGSGPFPFSTIIAAVMLVLGILLFAYYIHYVSKSIQINYYIDSLVDQATRDIKKTQTEIEEDETLTIKSPEELECLTEKKGTDYPSKKTGYITGYDTEALIDYAKDTSTIILIEKPVGSHVFEEDILMTFCGESGVSPDEEILDKAIRVDNEPNPYTEYLSSTIKLTEIAVRALSPGVNDPATAMHSIKQIGYIFTTLSDSHQNLVHKDAEGEDRLIMQGINYDQLLYDTFYQIKHYGINDFKVVKSILQAFIRIAKDSNPMTRVSVWEFAKYIFDDIPKVRLHPLDYKNLYSSLYQLAIVCNKADDYKKTFRPSKEDEKELNEEIEKEAKQ